MSYIADVLKSFFQPLLWVFLIVLFSGCKRGPTESPHAVLPTSSAYLLGNTAVISRQGHGIFAFSQDSKKLACGDGDGVISFWDLESGAWLGSLFAHDGSVVSLEFSQNEQTITSVGVDGKKMVWETKTGTKLKESTEGFQIPPLIQKTSAVDNLQEQAVFLSESGDLILHRRGVVNSEITLEKGYPFLVNVDFSPNGKRLAAVGDRRDRRLRIWDLERGQALPLKLTGHSKGLQAAAFSDDSKLIFTVAWDNKLVIWDVATKRPLQEIETDSVGNLSATVDPHGLTVLFGNSQGQVQTLDPKGGKITSSKKIGRFLIRDLSFSPDGKFLAAALSDGIVQVLDARLELMKTLEGHDGDVTSVAFSRDGKSLISAGTWFPVGVHGEAGDGHSIRVWDVPSWEERFRLLDAKADGSFACCVAVSPKKDYFASGNNDGSILIWSTITGKVMKKITGRSGSVTAAAFSPDGKFLALSRDSVRDGPLQRPTWGENNFAIEILETSNWTPTRTLKGHRDLVTRIVFSKDGKYLLSTSDDCRAILWPFD